LTRNRYAGSNGGLGFWWLPPATVQTLLLSLIAAVYIGFAVADGRPRGHRGRKRRRRSVRSARRGRRDRNGVAARCRLRRARAQGLLAGTPPVRGQHSVVAAILRRCRLARRHGPDRRDSRRSQLSLITTVGADHSPDDRSNAQRQVTATWSNPTTPSTSRTRCLPKPTAAARASKWCYALRPG